MQNVYINCFLIKRDIISFSFSVSLSFYNDFFSLLEFLLPCFSVAEFVFLDLLRLVLFI